MKVVGAFVHGKWFCTEACSEKDPETQQLIDLYNKGTDYQNVVNEDMDEEDVEIDI